MSGFRFFVAAAALLWMPWQVSAQELIRLWQGENAKTNIVFLPEAYMAQHKETFLADADMGFEAIFSYTPFKENMNKFNVFAVWVASEDSVLSDSRAKPTTYFEVVPPGIFTTESRMWELLQSFFLPRYSSEIVLMIYDDRIEGGGAPKIAHLGTGRLHHDTPMPGYDPKIVYSNILVHEFGHSFGGLADEYGSATDQEFLGRWDENDEEYWPNVTRETDRAKIKWRHLVSPDTPIPTPETPEYTNTVGLFDGAFYRDKGQGWYRPAQNCMMRDYSRFCAVCQEVLLAKIQDPLGNISVFQTSPPNPEFDLGQVMMGEEKTISFTVKNPGSDTLRVTEIIGYSSDGISSATNTEVKPDVFEIAPGDSQKVEVSYLIWLLPEGPGSGVSTFLAKYENSPDIGEFIRFRWNVILPSPDFDGDGFVGFSDFVAFAKVFGHAGALVARYDLTGDGAIEFADFVKFAESFGKEI